MKTVVWYLRHTRTALLGIATLAMVLGLSTNVVFADDSCPSGMSNIDCQAIQNDWTQWVPDVCGQATSTSGQTGALTGTDNIMEAFNYFMTKGGLSTVQIAGLLGNLYAESNGLNPNNSEDGKQDQTPISGIGFGIAQWTTAGRQQGLVALAASEGVPVTDLSVQLDYVWQELTGSYASVLSSLEATSDIQTATSVVMDNYEVPLVVISGTTAQQQQELQNRTNDASAILTIYGASAQAGSSSTTTVTTTSSIPGCTTVTPGGGSVVGCSFGSGGTLFTPNSTLATTSPGEISVTQMCQRAQLLAAGQLLNPQGNPFCANGSCAGLCDFVAAIVWGYPNASGYDCSYVHWETMVATGHAHPGDLSPPVGALLFFTDQYSSNFNPAITDCSNYNGHVLQTNYGHTVVYLGNNMVISSDWPSSGGISIIPITDITGGGKTGWNEPYLGWSDPVFAGD
jgi:hypothetical protein